MSVGAANEIGGITWMSTSAAAWESVSVDDAVSVSGTSVRGALWSALTVRVESVPVPGSVAEPVTSVVKPSTSRSTSPVAPLSRWIVSGMSIVPSWPIS